MTFVCTDIARGYTTERESGLSWVAAPGFAGGYEVRTATHPWDGVDWAFVDIDAADGSSVHLIGEGVSLDDLLATSHRLVSIAGAETG